MPFDPAPQVPAKPDAAFLSRVLREGPGGPFWPEGFVWDYAKCDQCGIGVARILWSKPFLSEFMLGLSSPQVFDCFCLRCSKLSLPSNKITPVHVADAIDAVLAARAVTRSVSV